MAQLKSTVVTGDLSVSDEIVASKIVKAGGVVGELLRANGEASALDWIKDLKDIVLQYVYTKTEVDNIFIPSMQFKGTVGTGGTRTSLPTASKDVWGDMYMVVSAGTYNSTTCKVGDTWICYSTDGSTFSWCRVPSGDDIEDTWRPVSVNGTALLSNGTNSGTVNFKNGTNISVSGSGTNITVSHATPTANSASKLTANANSTTAASWMTAKFVTGVEVSRDAQGHVTALGVTSNELPTEVVVGDTVTIKYDSTKKALKFVF